jgi:2-oxoglutarate dehydrogenase E1 component
VLCSGKVYFDLLDARAKRGRDDVYLMRLEQFYPWPLKSLMGVLARFKNADWSGARKSPRTWAAGPSSIRISSWDPGPCLDVKAKRPRYVGRPAIGLHGAGLMSRT